MHSVEPIDLFTSWVSNPKLLDQMYFGPQRIAKTMKVYPEAHQLWHGNVWGESIRATSGVAVRAQNNAILFPGDFVLYTEMPYNLEQEGRCDQESIDDNPAIGRFRRLVLDENIINSPQTPLCVVIEPLLSYR
jgi:hypothetical protein